MKKAILLLALTLTSFAFGQEIGIEGDSKNFMIDGVPYLSRNITWEEVYTDHVIFKNQLGENVTGRIYSIANLTLSTDDPLYATYGATFTDYAEFKNWAVDSLGKSEAAGGNVAKTFTGTEIPMTGNYFQDNTGIDTAVWTLSTTKVNRSSVQILIDQASEPSITGASQLPGTNGFSANTLSTIELVCIGSNVYYFFVDLE